MSQLDVLPDDRLLLRLLRDPGSHQVLTPHEFSRALDAADQARLLGYMLGLPVAALPENAPTWLKDRLTSAHALASEYERAIGWEINRLDRALSSSDIRWVLLKGAGYLAARLPTGAGRRVADIDILVSESDLARAEELLRAHGWEFPRLNAY